MSSQQLTSESLMYLYKSLKYTSCQQNIHALQHAIANHNHKEFKISFDRLPKSFQTSLCFVVSQYCSHEVNAGLGRKELNKNPSILLEIKNLQNQTILQQMDELLLDLSSKHKNIIILSLNIGDKSSASHLSIPLNVSASKAQNSNRDVLVELKTQINEAKRITDVLKTWFQKANKTTVYDTSIDQLAQKMTSKILQEPITVAMVGVEYAGLLSQGGLAEAIQGMAQGILKQNPNSKVKLIFPYYSTISNDIQQRLILKDQFYDSYGNNIPVFCTDIDGVECFFIKNDLFTLDERKPYIYGDIKEKERFFTFSNLAADVLRQMQNINVIHLHDWHVAGTAIKLAKESKTEWLSGKIPPIVFTFHNNNRAAQGRFDASPYNYAPIIKALQEAGSTQENANIFAEMLDLAEMVTTVSPTFAIEAQQPISGEGVSFAVRQAAKVGKLAGIVNGVNTSRWNPEKDPVLSNWKSDSGRFIDLSFGPNSLNACEQKNKAKIELGKWISKYLPAGRPIPGGQTFTGKPFNFDPNKPTVSYIGRLDSYQKGLDRLDEAIQATIESGGQFIIMGSQEDAQAKQILDTLEQKYPENVLFIRDYKDKNGRYHYQQGDPTNGIPGIGSIVRAAADVAIIPSRFEPCGLVQFEAWLYGALAIGSNTGGLADTIITPNKNPEHFNGYLFERDGDIKNRVSAVITKAINDLKSMTLQERDGMIKRLITEGRMYGWETSPFGLSPIEKYRFVYANAIGRVKQRKQSELNDRFDFHEHLRGLRNIQIKQVSDKTLIQEEQYLQEFYYGTKSIEALDKLYQNLPDWLRAQVPTPYAKVSGDLHSKYGVHSTKDGRFTFCVHAPQAKKVSVRLYNDKEELVTQVDLTKSSQGDWTSIPIIVKEGQRYHYKIDKAIKIDPFSSALLYSDDARKSPYSIIPSQTNFSWNDTDWMISRIRKAGTSQPMSIFEVHLSSFMKHEDGTSLNYKELAPKLVEHCRRLKFTHIQAMGILEHAYLGSMGYQVTNFFAPNSRMGTPEDFKYLVDYLHQNNIGIILDWIPTHFAKDEYGLKKFDNKNLFEPGLKGIFSKQTFYRWGTKFFDMSKPFVRSFLLSNAMHWLKDFHLDGIRVDAVRCLLDSPSPQATRLFLQQLNAATHSLCKGIFTIAEDYSGNEKMTEPTHKKGMGFDYTFNIGWTHFFLKFFSSSLDERRKHYYELIKGLESFNNQRCILGLSHDEVKKGKRSLLNQLIANPEHQLANIRAMLSLMMATPGKKLNFMGNEIGAENEWDIYLENESNGFMDSEFSQKGEPIRLMLEHLNDIYQTESALFEKDSNVNDLEWIEKQDPQRSLIAFRRIGDSSRITCIHNITQNLQTYVVPVKSELLIKEIFNSDLPEYGGKGNLNDNIGRIYNNGIMTGYEVKIPPMSTIMIKESSPASREE